MHPTIKIRLDNLFDVRILKTIIFPGPHKPLDFAAVAAAPGVAYGVPEQLLAEYIDEQIEPAITISM